MTDHSRFEVAIDDEEGRLLAAADIDLTDPSVARVVLHVQARNAPPGTRSRLVDAVLAVPEVAARRHLQVALPLGETEILERVRERCDGSQARAAGFTCFVDADVREAQQPETD